MNTFCAVIAGSVLITIAVVLFRCCCNLFLLRYSVRYPLRVLRISGFHTDYCSFCISVIMVFVVRSSQFPGVADAFV